MLKIIIVLPKAKKQRSSPTTIPIAEVTRTEAAVVKFSTAPFSHTTKY